MNNICKDCGKQIKSLGIASHRAMHYRDRQMLERFNFKDIENIKHLMKDGDSISHKIWCRRDIKDVYGINDRVLNIILNRK